MIAIQDVDPEVLSKVIAAAKTVAQAPATAAAPKPKSSRQKDEATEAVSPAGSTRPAWVAKSKNLRNAQGVYQNVGPETLSKAIAAAKTAAQRELATAAHNPQSPRTETEISSPVSTVLCPAPGTAGPPPGEPKRGSSKKRTPARGAPEIVAKPAPVSSAPVNLPETYAELENIPTLEGLQQLLLDPKLKSKANLFRWKDTVTSRRTLRKKIAKELGLKKPDETRRRLTFSRRRCDSPVLIRLLKEIYDANGIDLVET